MNALRPHLKAHVTAKDGFKYLKLLTRYRDVMNGVRVTDGKEKERLEVFSSCLIDRIVRPEAKPDEKAKILVMGKIASLASWNTGYIDRTDVPIGKDCEEIADEVKKKARPEFRTVHQSYEFEWNMAILKKAWPVVLVPVAGWVFLIARGINVLKASKQAAWFLELDINNAAESAKQEDRA